MSTHLDSSLASPSTALTAKARAAVLTAPRRFESQSIASPPEPAVGELRIRMEGCGVCASSLPSWQGREWFDYPFEPGKLGHEGWGVVDSVGPGVSPQRIGDRVVTWADGAFASHLCVEESETLAIPPGLEGEPLPVEPLGCAVNIVRRARVEAGMPVVVVGIGFLGALLVQLLNAAGCEVYAVAHRPFSQALARRLGVRAVAPFGTPEEVAEYLGAKGPREFPRVIEAVGLPASLDLASPLVGTGGALVVAGYHQDGLRSVNFQEWNWKGIDVINAHERDSKVVLKGMQDALGALQRGDLDLSPLLSHRYPLEELDEAFADLESRPDGFLKGWIDFTLNSANS